MPSFDLEHSSAGNTPPSLASAQPQSPGALSHAGNQAVQRMLRDEQDADRVAGEITSSPGGIESRFGALMGDVRIHTGPAAEQAASSLRARAFTQGSDIVFGRGEYDPGTPHGQFLLAHELAHVAQQAERGIKEIQRSPHDATCSAEDPASTTCEPIPDNPLAMYPFLTVALDPDSLQMLQDAAYRREHFRRGIPYTGPQGLFFAQAPLANFLAPGTEYVSREELLAALMPPLLDAARNHTDPEPYITEIARNEAARQMLDPIGNPLVNVEIPDPDGEFDTPTELTFTADFKKLPDDHGALALASLDPISKRGAYLWTLIALDDARQLSDIALLNARAEFLQQKVSDRLDDMAKDPADYAQNEVWEYWHNIIPDVLKTATTLESTLMPGNRDQGPLVAQIKGIAQELSDRALRAMDAMNEFRSTHMPDQTAGEAWEENAEDIRKAASKDWEEGGWSYFAWAGNKLGLGANKLVHGMGNVASGFYMDIHAARAHAYRMGDTSYNDFTGFHPIDLVKGAIGDLAVALPFFGKGIGAGASALLGLEEGSTAFTVTEGMTGGFASNFAGAAGTDIASFAASKLSLSESERRFQAAQIGGPLSWVESGAWGGIIGGGASFLTKMMPRAKGAPPAQSVEAEGTAASEPDIEPQVSMPEGEMSAADTGISAEDIAASTSGEPSVYQTTGIRAFFRRTLLSRLISSTLEGSAPFNIRFGSGPLADPLLSVVEGNGPLSTGVIDLANAPDLPGPVAGPVEVSTVNPVTMQVEVTEVATPSASPDVTPAQPGLQDMGGVTPEPGTRTTTRAQWQAQYRDERVERRIDAIFAQLEQAGGQQVAEQQLPAPMAIDLQRSIRDALQNLRASGRRAAGNASFGTMLHAELARVLRAAGFSPDVIAHVEVRLSAFNTLPANILQETVDQWLQNEGRAYEWVRSSLPGSVLNSLVGDIKPDLEISIAGNNIAFDLTSRERESHLAKTMLYAAILAREGQMTRVQEYYWVRWNWRGR
jgi:uncharacterized protein DUF4157